jgi:hypothetical protein
VIQAGLMSVGREGLPNSGAVFIATFAWSLLAGLAIQLVVLPYILPGLNAGDGLLVGGDWVGFHKQAVGLVGEMKTHGWRAWSLNPAGQAPVGIAAALYYITGISKPWVVLPINAVLFATSATLLFSIFSTFTGRFVSALAVVPFAFFPSAAVIYSQIHKDVFSISGFLLIIHSFACLSMRRNITVRGALGVLAAVGVGCALVWLVRPYLVLVILPASILGLASSLILQWRRSYAWWLCVLVCLVAQPLTLALPRQAGDNFGGPTSQVETVRIDPHASVLGQLVAKLNAVRVGFAEGYPMAGSNVDTHVRFNSVFDLAAYLPRALQLALFAPFPTMWTTEAVSAGGDIMKTISAVEMTSAYILLGGLIFLGPYTNRSGLPTLALVIVVSLTICLGLALVFTNVGTLYRMRYGYWQLLIGMGVVGWASLLGRRISPRAGKLKALD